MELNTIKFRKLRAEEIQVRPTDTKFKGSATLLLYQDARVAMDILDETVGAFNWQKDFKEVKDSCFCSIGIKLDKEWVWKSDCGMESNIDAQKGEASDAFKRAAVNWGIGRELYSTPRIKIKCPDSYYYNDKFSMTFTVTKAKFDENGETLELEIVDRFGKVVFSYPSNTSTEPQKYTYKANIPQSNIDIPQTPVKALNSLENGNYDTLVNFCKSVKEKNLENEETVNRLNSFFKFYKDKVVNWDGYFEPDKLFEKWR